MNCYVMVFVLPVNGGQYAEKKGLDLLDTLQSLGTLDNLEFWKLAVNIAFSAYLMLAFGIGCLIGHYIIYRIRG